MKVLVNKCGKAHIEKDIKPTKKFVCEYCDSELEYEESDIRFGALGCACINCPCCGEENVLYEEEGLQLTQDNVEFPTHFFHTSKETGAVDCCNNKEIKNQELDKKIIANEAVELAKKYGTDDSSSFVNGVLAKFA